MDRVEGTSSSTRVDGTSMEILVNANGRRNTDNRPYIDGEEMKRNVLLYDPNGYNLDTGLYERPLPACQRWVDYFHQDQIKHHTRPFATVRGDGKMILNPSYYQPRDGSRLASQRPRVKGGGWAAGSGSARTTDSGRPAQESGWW